MKAKPLILTSIMLAPVAFLRAGDDLVLDQNFSFRLTAPDLRQSPPVPPPTSLPNPEKKHAAPRTTPEGVPLPPGSRAFQFNGVTYYFIPL